jgi:16S rRNA (uracil1498-N3)-methyltransferase
MPDRFFVDGPLTAGAARLEGPEAHHFAHVLRGAAGDEIVVFNGRGAEWRARVERVGRAEIALTLLEQREIDRELPVSIHLGVALPKGDRQRWLVEKLVELGAARLTLLHTQRSTAQSGDDAGPKLRRAAIEAAKQCGGNRLLEFGPRAEFGDWLARAPAGAKRYLAHPAKHAASAKDLCNDVAGAEEAWFAVGPEGGFTDDEVAAAGRAGWTVVSLGPRLLRVETAALALATLAAAAACP